MGDVWVFSLMYLPQSLFFFWAGLAFFRITKTWRQLLLMSLAFALSIWGVRCLFIFFSIPLGSHTAILLAIAVGILRVIGKVDWVPALGISVLCMALVLLGNFLGMTVSSLLNVSPNQALFHPWQQIVWGQSENILTVLLLIGCKKRGWTIPDMFSPQESREGVNGPIV